MAESKTAPTTMTVEVAYALPDRQVLLVIEVPPATTAGEAVERSAIATQFPELAQATPKIGVFGKLCKPEQPLREGDRVEVYRPLIADPKKVRKERAAKGKTTRKGAAAINS